MIALHLAFDPDKNHRINRLRTGKTAKQAASQCCHKKQGGCSKNKHQGEQQGILRPQHQIKQIEFFVRNVEQNGLTRRPIAFPTQPASAVENCLSKPDHRPAQAVEATINRLGVDFPFFAIQRQLGFANLADRFVHFSSSQ